MLDITTSGTASAPITFEAAPGQTPVINSSGGWNAINIEASYIVVNGFTVVGDAANYTLQHSIGGVQHREPEPRWERHSRQLIRQWRSPQPHHDREQHGLQRTRRWHL